MSTKTMKSLLLMALLSLGAPLTIGCSEGGSDDNIDLSDDSESDSATTPVDTNNDDTTSDSASEAITDTESDSASEDEPIDTDVYTNATHIYEFGSDAEGWALEYGRPSVLRSDSTLDVATDDGYRTDGALQLVVPFSDVDQSLQTQVDLTNGIDLTGKTVYARVKLVDGLTDDPNIPGGAKVYAKSGDVGVWADGGWNNLETDSGWIEIWLDIDYPEWDDKSQQDTDGNAVTFDATDIRAIGIEFNTNSTAPGTEFSFLDATILVDDVMY